jgi:hypothetical protein
MPYLTKTRSWDTVREHFAKYAPSWKGAYDSIQPLLDWIRQHDLEGELFAFTSMYDLVITDQPEIGTDHHRLRITAIPADGSVRFVYTRHEGATDAELRHVGRSHATETLRLMLAYKFGVHRGPDSVSNQSTDPTPKSVTPVAGQPPRQP